MDHLYDLFLLESTSSDRTPGAPPRAPATPRSAPKAQSRSPPPASAPRSHPAAAPADISGRPDAHIPGSHPSSPPSFPPWPPSSPPSSPPPSYTSISRLPSQQHLAAASIPSSTMSAPHRPPTPTRRPATPTRPATPPAPASVVAYDVVGTHAPGSGPVHYSAPPWRLALRDLRFLLAHWPLLLRILAPFRFDTDITVFGLAVQAVLLAVSLALTVLVLVSLVGLPPVLVTAAVCLAWILLCGAVQGPETRQSKADVPHAPGADREAWFSVNGVATTGTGAQLIADRIEGLFHRPVTAVLNRSLGILWDLLECILQRDFLLVTSDIRVGYRHIRQAIIDETKERVVIVAHSQGGIIASAWADQLLCDFPVSALNKVEFYTFASAADHFARPSLSRISNKRIVPLPDASTDGTGPATKATAAAREQPFGTVEHFANELDFVARFGVVSHAPPPPARDEPGSLSAAADAVNGWVPGSPQPATGERLPTTRGSFGGRIFLRPGRTGHLFNAHYVFPGESILDDPVVRAYSRLTTYLGGGNPVGGSS